MPEAGNQGACSLPASWWSIHWTKDRGGSSEDRRCPLQAWQQNQRTARREQGPRSIQSRDLGSLQSRGCFDESWWVSAKGLEALEHVMIINCGRSGRRISLF